MLNLFLLALSLVPLADNVVTFLLLWELMSVASYFLVLTESDRRETRQAGLWYLAMAHGGLVLLMAAFLLVAASAPSTGFADLRAAAAALPSPCAQCRVPPRAPRVRVEGRPGPAPRVAPARAPGRPEPRVGAHVRRHDQDGRLRAAAGRPRPARRRPALVGRGRPGGGGGLRAPGRPLRADGAGPQAAPGLLLRRERRDHLPRHRGGHAVPELRARRPSRCWGSSPASTTPSTTPASRASCFSASGAVLHATHTRNMEELGGLIKGMPRTALCFLVGAAAISGLPPLNGFVSEWLVFQALLGGPQLPRAELGRAHAARGGDARPHQRAGRGVLREGLRHLVPRHAPLGPRRPGAGGAPGHAARRWVRSRCACVALGVLPSLVVPVLSAAVAGLGGLPAGLGDRDAGADARDARYRGRDRARRPGGRARAGVGGRGAWPSGSAPPTDASAWGTPGAAAASARRPGWSTRRPRSRSRSGGSSPSSTARPRISRSTSTPSRDTSSSRSRTGARCIPGSSGSSTRPSCRSFAGRPSACGGSRPGRSTSTCST